MFYDQNFAQGCLGVYGGILMAPTCKINTAQGIICETFLMLIPFISLHAYPDADYPDTDRK